MIKDKNGELEFVLEREEMTTNGYKRALDIQTRREWESKEVNAKKQCELEIELKDTKIELNEVKEELIEERDIR